MNREIDFSIHGFPVNYDPSFHLISLSIHFFSTGSHTWFGFDFVSIAFKIRLAYHRQEKEKLFPDAEVEIKIAFFVSQAF